MGKTSREKKNGRRAREKAAISAARPELWEKCKEKFGLTDEDVRKAKELGMLPEKMIIKPVTPAEHWKMPQRSWIRHCYNKRQTRLEKKAKSKAKWERKQARLAESVIPETENTKA